MMEPNFSADVYMGATGMLRFEQSQKLFRMITAGYLHITTAT